MTNVDLTEDIALIKELADLRCGDNFSSECELLVSNLAYGTTERMIKSLFGQHGKVDCIEFYPDNNMAVVEYEDSFSIDKVFAHQESSAKGLSLRGSTLNCVHLDRIWHQYKSPYSKHGISDCYSVVYNNERVVPSV